MAEHTLHFPHHQPHSRLFNSDSIDAVTAYLTKHFEHLEGIERAVRDTLTVEQYGRRKSMVALDGTGAGTLRWDIPFGYDWILQRVTVTSTGAGSCQFFVDSTASSDLVENIANSQLYSDAFSNNLYVPGGSPLFAVFAGAGANGQATVNLQLKIVKRPAHTHGTHRTQGEP